MGGGGFGGRDRIKPNGRYSVATGYNEFVCGFLVVLLFVFCFFVVVFLLLFFNFKKCGFLWGFCLVLVFLVCFLFVIFMVFLGVFFCCFWGLVFLGFFFFLGGGLFVVVGFVCFLLSFNFFHKINIWTKRLQACSNGFGFFKYPAPNTRGLKSTHTNLVLCFFVI